MSFLLRLARHVPTWVRGAWRWLRNTPHEPPTPHWVPAANTREAWSVGSGRCFWCLADEHTPQFEAPCPRRRPSQVELA